MRKKEILVIEGNTQILLQKGGRTSQDLVTRFNLVTRNRGFASCYKIAPTEERETRGRGDNSKFFLSLQLKTQTSPVKNHQPNFSNMGRVETICLSKPNCFGSTPTAKATNCGKCNTGKPNFCSITFSTSG